MPNSRLATSVVRPGPAAIPPSFSAYLDLVRLFAASMVVVHHIKQLQVGPEIARRFIPAWGHEFVVVFFVLSGYVIASAVDRKRASTLRDYALDRAARIYSVAIPTLLISTLVALSLHTMFGFQEPGAGTLQQVGNGVAFNLVFLAESWSLNAVPPSNPAFWSLSYEVMYYALFGCVHFLTGRRRLIALVILALAAGPKVLLLMPCWLLGVAAYRWRDLVRLRPYQALGALAGSILLMALMSLLHLGAVVHNALTAMLGPWHASLMWSSEFPRDWISAALVALHLYAARQLPLKLPAPMANAAVRGAALTFTLYLLHYPVLLWVRLAFGARAGSSWACLFAAVVAVVAATWLVGSFSEAKRHQLRAVFARRITSSASTV